VAGFTQTKPLAMIAVMTAIAATPANAVYFYDGHDAYNWCVRDAGNSVMLAHCSGYVTGLIDQASYNGYDPCLPDGVTVGRMRDAFALYLTDHPDLRDLEASALFEMALSEAFPC
jgi:hypothetical protein